MVELAERIQAKSVAFSIDAFKEAYPQIWEAVRTKLGARDDSSFRYLKDGKRGSAYLFGSNEVVKFTTDLKEVEAMAKVAGQEPEFIVHVSSVFKFPYPKAGKVLGAIRQERLQPGASDWKNFGEVATFYFSQILNHPFDPSGVPQFKKWAVERFSKMAQGMTVQADEEGTKVPPLSRRKPGVKPTPREEDVMVFRETEPDKPWGKWVSKSAKMPTEEMFTWFEGLCKELQKFGILFWDLNAGNMMKRGGVHVVIDLGYSQVKSPPTIDDELVRQFEQTAALIEAFYALGADDQLEFPLQDERRPVQDYDILQALQDAEDGLLSDEEVERLGLELQAYPRLEIKSIDKKFDNVFVVDDKLVDFERGFVQIYEPLEWMNNASDVIDEIAEKIAERFDDEFHESPGTLYHATQSANIPSIQKSGLKARNASRGLTNRHVGPAIFCVGALDEIDDVYGDATLAIDVEGMQRDGIKYSVTQEPSVLEREAANSLAYALDIEDYEHNTESDGADDPRTIILYCEKVPPKYIKVVNEISSAVLADAPNAIAPKELTGLTNIWRVLAQKLNIDITRQIRQIGEGSNGTAYLVDDRTVLKLTRDRTEAQAMSKVIGRKSHYIVETYRVINIGNRLFAITMEKLAPPSADWKKLFVATEQWFSMEEPVSDETVTAFVKQWQQEMPIESQVVRADGMDDWGDINPGDDIEIDKLTVKKGIKWPGPFNEKQATWLMGLAHELTRLGIKFGDMNPNNIMKRPGTEDHVVIDLGMSRTNGAPQIELLEDAEEPQ